jgi:hypothetical protein
MKIARVLIILLAGSVAFAAEKIAKGESVDKLNLFCENIESLKFQKNKAQIALKDSLRMKEGICAWTYPDGVFHIYEESQKILIYDLQTEGCKVEITVQYGC